MSPGETSGSMILIIFILANSFLLWEWSTLLSSLLFEEKLFVTFLIRQVLYRGVHRLFESQKPPFRILPLLELESENLQLFHRRREFPPCLRLQNVGGGEVAKVDLGFFLDFFEPCQPAFFQALLFWALVLYCVIHKLFVLYCVWALLCFSEHIF